MSETNTRLENQVQQQVEQFLELPEADKETYFQDIGHFTAGKRIEVATSEAGMHIVVGEIKDNKSFVDFTVLGNGYATRYQSGKDLREKFEVAQIDEDEELFGDNLGHKAVSIGAATDLEGVIASLPKSHIQTLASLSLMPEFTSFREKQQRKRNSAGLLGRFARKSR